MEVEVLVKVLMAVKEVFGGFELLFVMVRSFLRMFCR
jgi:hypothetical protein